MKNAQPNFELLKRSFYQAYVNSKVADFSVLYSSLSGTLQPCWLNKKEEFKKDFNQWLDRLDIRQCGTIIQILKDGKHSVPAWMANGQYVIDYNHHSALDLIRIN